MPPKKTKDPAEPASGEGAESTAEPGDPSGGAGVRTIGDPELLRTLSEFRAAIGVDRTSKLQIYL